MFDHSANRSPQSTIHCVIMAGGGGTRFWPRSRQQRPKQFLSLAGDRSLLQQAAERLAVLAPPAQTWVITASSQATLVKEQLEQLPSKQLVGEPLGRDTAAAVGLAAALVNRTDPNGVMIVTPADHLIEPAVLFQRTLAAAVEVAGEHSDALITLGIPPTFPATGYGYIHRGEALPGRNGLTVYRAREFKEKPDAATAQQYVRGGDYFWNSGIFIWRVAAIREELRHQQPTLFAALDRIAAAWGTPRQDEVFRQEYAGLTKISIDYAVMEKAKEVIVLQAPFAWDDVGSWPALTRHHPQDFAGNTVLATRHLAIETKNCIIVGDGGDKLVATVGVENLLIVRDGDALLVADARDEAGVKKLVEQLRSHGLDAFA